MLKGTAKNKMEKGKTPKFPITSHINTKPAIHEIATVCIRVNLFDKRKIVKAKNNDHIPHIAPLTGSEEKTRPSLS